MLEPWILTCGALAGGALGTAHYLVRVLGARVDGDAFATMIQKLLTSARPSRALMLAKAAPQCALCAATHQALLVCRDRSATNDAAKSYRTGRGEEASNEQALTGVRARYEDGFDHAMRPVRRARWSAAAGGMLFGLAAIAPCVAPETPIAVAITGGAGVLLLLAGARAGIRRLHAQHGLMATLDANPFTGAHIARAYLLADPDDVEQAVTIIAQVGDRGGPVRHDGRRRLT